MGIKKSATFTDEEFREAVLVAEYKTHTFSRFIVHCVVKESHRYLKDAIKARDKIDQLRAVGGCPTSGAAF